MRSDHAYFAPVETPLPSQDELERAMARARRMRSAVVHDYLARAWTRAREALRRGRAPAEPAAQCC